MSFLWFYTLMASMAFFSVLPAAAMEPPRTLLGPAFSDPNHVAPKSDTWVKRPIIYTKAHQGADVTVVLDQHTYPALLPMVQAYARKHKLNIAVKEGTCGISEGMLNRKQLDIGGYCCPAAAQERLPGLTFHTLGISALAILAHPENPVDNLTANEVRKIFQGQMTQWPQVQSAKGKQYNKPIQPVARLHCKIRPGHWRLILDNEDLFHSRVSQVGSIPDMIAQVAKLKGSLGYEEIWITTHRYKKLGQVKLLHIDGYDPMDHASLIQGHYPFYRVHNISTWEAEGLANPQAQALVSYLRKNMDQVDPAFQIIPADQLPAGGWSFKGTEIIAAP
ncbi:substrate-binding domain-containing protein [Magnetococcus sp. PR-3]|uniref:substrate-binding domain-containing protein n=1 Tax=Magnetococcus sp. PR-3 TaxID=3120355 RepID=UPI002FCE00A5